MKKVKQFFAVAAVAGMTALMGANSAEAGTAIGKVTMVDDFGTYAYVYIRALSSGSAAGTTSYCMTTNHDQRTTATAAAAGNVTVRLWGNGTAVSGYLGSCTYVDMLALN